MTYKRQSQLEADCNQMAALLWGCVGAMKKVVEECDYLLGKWLIRVVVGKRLMDLRDSVDVVVKKFELKEKDEPGQSI